MVTLSAVRDSVDNGHYGLLVQLLIMTFKLKQLKRTLNLDGQFLRVYKHRNKKHMFSDSVENVCYD